MTNTTLVPSTINPAAAGQATIVDRIPTWATSVGLEPDGYVLYTRVVREDVEIQQSSHLAVNEEAGTVSYQAVDGLQAAVAAMTWTDAAQQQPTAEGEN